MALKTDTGRLYHTACTGDALVTVKAHEVDQDITLFGSCFCPFVQRVWVAFEILGIPYKYYEVDPYKKPKELLDISPKGLVPGLRFNRYNPPRALNESTVIMEYLEECVYFVSPLSLCRHTAQNSLASTTTKRSILPPITNPYARGLIRLQADHINRSLIPSFYRYLQAQTEDKQVEAGQEFRQALDNLVGLLERTEREILSHGGTSGVGEVQELQRGLGVWIPGQTELSWADIMAGPWLFRAKVVLTHYRGFQLPDNDLVNGWLNRLFNHPAFKSTCSTEELYLDSYERYAYNRPKTSMVATAINEGNALP